MNEDEFARVLNENLCIESGIRAISLMATMRDGASVNEFALNRKKFIFPKMFKIFLMRKINKITNAKEFPGHKVGYKGPDGRNARRQRRGPRVLGTKFRRGRKNLDFSRTGLAKDCRKVRKGLPKLRSGSNKHSKESGSGIATRF